MFTLATAASCAGPASCSDTKATLTALEAIFAPICALFSKAHCWLADCWVELVIFALAVVLSIVAAIVVDGVMRLIIRYLASRTASSMDDHILQVIRRPLLLVIIASGTVCGIAILPLSKAVRAFGVRAYYAALTFAFVWFLLRLIMVISEHMKFSSRLKGEDNKLDELLIDLIRRVSKTVVWVIAIIFVAQNLFKLNVTALITGAGVAGLAVAFAAQNTIANIFGAITLIIDKPFTIGDRIVANGKDGVVLGVGLRSTVIRSLDGTTWSIPNKELSEASIQNLTRRPSFRQILDIGLVYNTTPEQIERAKEILHEIIDSEPLFSPEQPAMIRFSALKDWSLNIQIIMWYHTADFGAMMASLEKINFEILRRFNAENLEFAFPSNTTYLAGDATRPQIVKEG